MKKNKYNYSNKLSQQQKSFRTMMFLFKKNNIIKLTPLSALLIFLFFPNITMAACKGVSCACQPSEIQFSSPVAQANADGQYDIALEADSVEAQGKERVSLVGNAEVTQGRRTIVADKIDYYRDSERVVASGHVEMISENGDYLSSDAVDVTVPTQIGELRNTKFKLAQNLSRQDGVDTVQIASRGRAEVVNLEGEGVVSLKNGRFTNCPEGNNSVVIGASKIKLDQLSGIGTARNATLRFQGIPIFYSPYLSFPLNDERKTGLLLPSFGADEESGQIFEFPWYWNIAKNQDATITPRYFTDRGTQIAVEYRLRTQKSNTFIYGEYLPSDDLFEDQSRDLLSVYHSQNLTKNLRVDINYNDVSDVDYFEDLRNDVRYFSATYVPRDISMNYNHQYFNLRVRANQYQIIDPDVPLNNQPYERLPSVSFNSKFQQGPLGLQYGVNASYTDFQLDGEPSGERPEGGRFAFTPYVSLPLKNIWGYFTPKISLHNRQYSLENTDEGEDSSPSFSVPVFSLDTGLYFEKNTRWFGESVLHTLEPRVFYVYAPSEDQSDIPSFDTGQLSLNNFNQIYKELRFFGLDQVGDTNQVTFGLTTRIIDNKSGNERLTASIGQLYLIDDLEQNIGDGIIESGLGDLFADFKTRFKSNWQASGFLRYNHDESEVTNTSLSVGYSPSNDSRKNIRLGYYFSKGFEKDNSQVSLSANLPITDRWSFFGAERYDLEQSEALSTTLGVEYDSCCWKTRLTAQQSINNRDINDKIWSFFLQLELTSLGSVRTGL